MSRRTLYVNLPLKPFVIAQAVCEQVYTGMEFSSGLLRKSEIVTVEAERLKMTPDDIKQFAVWCDTRCRQAYDSKAAWFERCVKAKGNSGRDQLYIWLTHWLAGYLKPTTPVGWASEHPMLNGM